MNKRQEEIIEAILISFDISWSNNYTTKDLGTEKQFTFKDETFTMFPNDYEVIEDLIKIFNGKKIQYIPSNFHDVAKKYCNGELFLYEASEECGLSEETFKSKLKKYNYVKTRRKKKGHRYFINKDTFNYLANKYKNGEYSALECARLLGIGNVTFVKYLREQEIEVEDNVD